MRHHPYLDVIRGDSRQTFHGWPNEADTVDGMERLYRYKELWGGMFHSSAIHGALHELAGTIERPG